MKRTLENSKGIHYSVAPKTANTIVLFYFFITTEKDNIQLDKTQCNISLATLLVLR